MSDERSLSEQDIESVHGGSSEPGGDEVATDAAAVDADVAAPTDVDPATGLHAVLALRRLIDDLERRQVAQARRAGWSWQQIGDALGISRQAAHKKYPQAVPNVMAISKTNRPPCKLSCPAECNGQCYVALISKGKYLEAVNHIKKWLPLPATLGRICHHPCEINCNRNDIDEPIGIRPLKRFVADIVREKRAAGELPPEEKLPIDPNKPRAAIVGSGPAGLACALDLARLGYPVKVFEANAHAGGALYYSIPA